VLLSQRWLHGVSLSQRTTVLAARSAGIAATILRWHFVGDTILDEFYRFDPRIPNAPKCQRRAHKSFSLCFARGISTGADTAQHEPQRTAAAALCIAPRACT
jgi:hypothetical protein